MSKTPFVQRLARAFTNVQSHPTSPEDPNKGEIIGKIPPQLRCLYELHTQLDDEMRRLQLALVRKEAELLAVHGLFMVGMASQGTDMEAALCRFESFGVTVDWRLIGIDGRPDVRLGEEIAEDSDSTLADVVRSFCRTQDEPHQ